MIEFVALIGLEAHAGAYAIMCDAARAEGWQITEMEPCGWIAVRNAGVQRVALENGQAFIVGDTVPMRRLGEERFEDEEALCRVLAHEGWGRYVVLFIGIDGGLSGVFRDPSGAVDCARAQLGWCWTVASQTPDWLVDATNDHPPICWTTVAQVLRDPVLLSSADMLSSWRTVTPGVLHLTAGATRIIWSPSLVARRGRPANEVRLRAVVDATVRDMTTARTSILTEVSGGLDSAIMATALKASGFGGEVIWLNTSGPFTRRALDQNQLLAASPLRGTPPHRALRRALKPADIAGGRIGDAGLEGAVPQTVDQQPTTVGRPGSDHLTAAIRVSGQSSRRGGAVCGRDENLGAQHQIQRVIFVGPALESGPDALESEA